MTFAVSIYTSPTALGKAIRIDSNDDLVKVPLANLSEGTVQTERFTTLEEFAARRESLSEKQALGYGVCGHKDAAVVLKRVAKTSTPVTGDTRPVVARGGKFFYWSSGPGLLMLDYDPAPGHPSLTADELVALLRQVVPQLASTTLLWTPSSGSNLWQGDRERKQVSGAHVYAVVTDARCIPDVGHLIANRLVLAGHGYIAVSGSGRMLKRCPVDMSVWQPERLDFVRANCIGDLEQRLAPYRIFPSLNAVTDHAGELPPDSLTPLSHEEEIELSAMWQRLSASKVGEAEIAMDNWARKRAKKELGATATATEVELLAGRHREVARSGQLSNDHKLYLTDGRVFTVGDLKSRPEEFDGVTMADPDEPDYRGDMRIAIAYLHPGEADEPIIYSHAHGGIKYRLNTAEDDLAEIEADMAKAGGPGTQHRAVRVDAPVVIDPRNFPEIAERLCETYFNPSNAGRLVRWQGDWFQHRKDHYADLGDELVEAAIWKFLRKCQYRKGGELIKFLPGTAAVHSVSKALQANVQACMQVAPSWLELYGEDPSTPLDGIAPRDVIAVANGLLHVPSGRLLPHTDQYFNRNALPFAYAPGAACPNWLRFLESVWPDDAEAQRCMQEWMGYLISGDTRLQKMLLIVGVARSGKGTIQSVIHALLGATNVASPSLADLGTPFGLYPLVGKMAAVIPDARGIHWRDNSKVVERLLNISGEDVVTADRKGRDPWVGQLPSRVVIMSNELPKLTDASNAFVNRFIMLYMPISHLGNEDHGLKDRLAGELPGIFNWALEGLARLRINRCFHQPASGAELRYDMERLGNPISGFFEDCCEVNPGLSVSKDRLYARYKVWCTGEGRQASSKEVFVKQLRAAFPAIQISRPRAEESRLHVLSGVGLLDRDPWEDEAKPDVMALAGAAAAHCSSAASLH